MGARNLGRWWVEERVGLVGATSVALAAFVLIFRPAVSESALFPPLNETLVGALEPNASALLLNSSAELNRNASLFIHNHTEVITAIRRQIFHGYDSRVRPSSAEGAGVRVSVAPRPFYVEDIDESQGKFTILCGLDLYWRDPRLVWEPAEHMELGCVFVELREVWVPEVRFTLATKDVSDLSQRSPARVCADGLVHIIDFRHVTRAATFQTALFPHDIQEIKFGFGQVTASRREVDMRLREPLDYREVLRTLVMPAEWGAEKMGCANVVFDSANESPPSSYAFVYCRLLVRRDPSSVLINFVLPSFTVTLLSVWAIHSSDTAKGPSNAKYEIGLMSLMSVSVLTLSIASSLPKAPVLSRLHIFSYAMTCAIASSCLVSWGSICLQKYCHISHVHALVYDTVSLLVHCSLLFFVLFWFIYLH